MTFEERIRREVDLVRHQYGAAEFDSAHGALLIPEFPLPSGWNRSETWVLILVPPGYPTTPPDNFYTDPGLRLASGSPPSNTSAGQRHAGRSCLMFSYHLESGDWWPGPEPDDGHNLLTFLAGVARRFEERS